MNNIKAGEAVLAGSGRNRSPAGPVPDVERGDCDRNAAADYEATDDIGKAWIRRAFLAEQFAKSLEKELELLRRQ